MHRIDPSHKIDPISPLILDQAPLKAPSPIFLSPQSTPSFALPALEKPKLAHPSTITPSSESFSQIIMNVLRDLEIYKETLFEMLDREVSQFNSLAKINFEKHVETERQMVEIGKTNQRCDFIKKTGAMLLGVASIFLGGTLLVPGASLLTIVAGSSMIISGGTSILGSLLSDAKSSPQLANALMVTGSIFAIVSGISGAFLSTNLLNGSISRIVSAFLAFTTGGASAVQNMMKWDLSKIKTFDALLKTFDDLYQARLSQTEQGSRDFERATATSLRDLIIAQKTYQSSCKKITNNYI